MAELSYHRWQSTTKIIENQFNFFVSSLDDVVRSILGRPAGLLAVFGGESAPIPGTSQSIREHNEKKKGAGFLVEGAQAHFPPRCTGTNSFGHPSASPMLARISWFAGTTEASPTT